MVEALIVSNLVLWCAVLALAAVVFALVRQVGVLHERVSPAGALSQGAGPQVGDPAPVVDVSDWAGKPRRIGGVPEDGRAILLFFASPTCPVCKTLLPVLDAVVGDEDADTRIVVASDGPRDEHERFVERHGLADRYVLSTDLGMTWGVAKLPHAVLIDGAGVVRASGLVNTREHLESLFEARERGVASVQEWAAGSDGASRVA